MLTNVNNRTPVAQKDRPGKALEENPKSAITDSYAFRPDEFSRSERPMIFGSGLD